MVVNGRWRSLSHAGIQTTCELSYQQALGRLAGIFLKDEEREEGEKTKTREEECNVAQSQYGNQHFLPSCMGSV
jgi:hypothetical protein